MLPNCFRAEGKFVKEFFGGCWMLRGVDEISSYNYPLRSWNLVIEKVLCMLYLGLLVGARLSSTALCNPMIEKS